MLEQAFCSAKLWCCGWSPCFSWVVTSASYPVHQAWFLCLQGSLAFNLMRFAIWAIGFRSIGILWFLFFAKTSRIGVQQDHALYPERKCVYPILTKADWHFSVFQTFLPSLFGTICVGGGAVHRGLFDPVMDCVDIQLTPSVFYSYVFIALHVLCTAPPWLTFPLPPLLHHSIWQLLNNKLLWVRPQFGDAALR